MRLGLLCLFAGFTVLSVLDQGGFDGALQHLDPLVHGLRVLVVFLFFKAELMTEIERCHDGQLFVAGDLGTLTKLDELVGQLVGGLAQGILLSQGTGYLVGTSQNDDFYGLYAHAFLNTAGLIPAFIHVDNWAGLYSADA